MKRLLQLERENEVDFTLIIVEINLSEASNRFPKKIAT